MSRPLLPKHEVRGEEASLILNVGAKFRHSGRGERSVATVSLVKHCAKFYQVKMADEFNTTKSAISVTRIISKSQKRRDDK